MRLELHWLIHATILSRRVCSVRLAQIIPSGVGSEIQWSTSRMLKSRKLNRWMNLTGDENDHPSVTKCRINSLHVLCSYYNSNSSNNNNNNNNNNCSLDYGINIALKSKHPSCCVFTLTRCRFFVGSHQPKSPTI